MDLEMSWDKSIATVAAGDTVHFFNTGSLVLPKWTHLVYEICFDHGQLYHQKHAHEKSHALMLLLFSLRVQSHFFLTFAHYNRLHDRTSMWIPLLAEVWYLL